METTADAATLTLRDELRTTYSYEGGFFDPGDQEFRGFATVIASRWVDGVVDRVTRTAYHQDAVHAGQVQSVEIRDGEGSLWSRTLMAYVPAEDIPGQNVAPPFISLLRSTTREQWDREATPARSRVEYRYDENASGLEQFSYGNVTSEIEYGDVTASGSDSVPGDTRRFEVVYAAPNASSNLVDRPAIVRLRAGSAYGTGPIVRESQLFYDCDDVTQACALGAMPSRGNLTRRDDILDEAPAADPVTRYEYDDFGNRTSVTNPRGFLTSTSYDSDLHTFPIAITNARGHQTVLGYAAVAGACSRSYPPGAGLTQVAWDPNGTASDPATATITCRDVFGRVVSVRAPDDLAFQEITYWLTSETARSRVGTSWRTAWTRSYDGLGRLKSESSDAPVDSFDGRPVGALYL